MVWEKVMQVHIVCDCFIKGEQMNMKFCKPKPCGLVNPVILVYSKWQCHKAWFHRTSYLHVSGYPVWNNHAKSGLFL